MKSLTLPLILLAFMSSASFAQKDTVSVQGYFETGQTYGTLNVAIQAARDAGTTNSTVFRLKPNERYVLTASIFVDHGESLDIWAPKAGATEESAPPQIVWTDNTGVDRLYLIKSYGDVKMQNVWVRYADVLGAKVATSITFENRRSRTGRRCISFSGYGQRKPAVDALQADHCYGDAVGARREGCPLVGVGLRPLTCHCLGYGARPCFTAIHD